MPYNTLITPSGTLYSWDIETTQKAEPVSSESKFFIIWEPTSSYPPTRRFAAKRSAEIVAEKMAKDNAGKAFYVLEASAYFQIETVAKKVLV